MPMRLIVAAICSLALSACSDPKAASEKNFKSAIQAFLDIEYPRCYVLIKIPQTLQAKSGDKRLFDALTKAGALTATESQVEVNMPFKGKQLESALKYDLTDEGKKFYRAEVEKRVFGDSVGGLCFGKATVTEITNFTEPADIFGVKVSRVQYGYAVSALPAWSKSTELLALYPQLKADVESEAKPVKAIAGVVLTHNGWMHEKLFSR